ncbi:MAG: hypothetical protein ACTHNK_18405 [Thermomicrobiales bacterium]
MADGLERLLEHLVERDLGQQDQKAVQLIAGSREPGETITLDQQLALGRERQRATELGPAFAAGLRRAYAARLAGQSQVTLDDRQHDENAMADALVQFLVRSQLASSHAEQTEPNHYVYEIAIDWGQLAQVAAASGINLDAELARS